MKIGSGSEEDEYFPAGTDVTYISDNPIRKSGLAKQSKPKPKATEEPKSPQITFPDFE